jgi:hypothetical protein
MGSEHWVAGSIPALATTSKIPNKISGLLEFSGREKRQVPRRIASRDCAIEVTRD